MKTFRFAKPRSGSDVAFIVEDPATHSVSGKVYSSDELYPLSSDRYYTNLPNLFIDVLDLIDGNEPAFTGEQVDPKTGRAPTITLHSLARRAQRAAADGSGKAQRFQDAKNLWNVMETHVLKTVVTPEAAPIVDVRKAQNWRKNQPFAATPANPQAWYVTDVFSRSNPLKNPIEVYRGLGAIFDALMEELDDLAAADLTAMKSGITDNLCFPAYSRVAEVLNDSNMLVFHNDVSFASWIRESAAAQENLDSSTPALIHTASPQTKIPGDLPASERVDLGSDNPVKLTVSNLANRLSPRT